MYKRQKYSCMNQKWKDQLEYMDHFYMNLAGEDRYVGILKYVQDGITFYFIDNEYYFNGFAPYDGDPRWNIEKFAFFSKAVLSILPVIDFRPELIHCHDWQTGLIPVYLDNFRFLGEYYRGIKSVMTIHNLKFQGVWDTSTVRQITGLPEYYFAPDKLEAYRDANLDVYKRQVLGGDGTLIRAARELAEYEFPLIGINLGTLGFLAEVERSDFSYALERLFKNQVGFEERMMLSGEVSGNSSYQNVAVNDIVITRDGSLRIVHFDVYVNGTLLNSYMADGVIISTPTGTTGYNLSAGGPVVEPTASMFVITPICSHALNTSSIVLSAEDTIEIVISQGRYGKDEQALVTFDGADMLRLGTGDRVTIKRSDHVTRLAKLSEESFMKTMRKKMKGN